MLSFVTSQAIALSQAKQKSSKSPARGQRDAALRKGFFTRVFDALFEARMRRAEIEIEQHRRFHEGHMK